MDRLLLEAKATLGLLELLDSTEPTPNNVWNEKAHRLRAAIDRLQAELKVSTATTDTEEPTRAL